MCRKVDSLDFENLKIVSIRLPWMSTLHQNYYSVKTEYFSGLGQEGLPHFAPVERYIWHHPSLGTENVHPNRQTYYYR
jgi:hypothetical protein